MMVLYGIAAALGGFVANTSNLSERYIGWSTKWGDGAGDFAPLADYTVEEVLAIGKELGVPDELLYKTPEDGLTGKSDEEAIGVEYALIDQYIRGEKPDNYKACRIIYERNEANLHKMAAQNIPHPRAGLQYEDMEDDWVF
jgi:NAD+ synthase